MRARGQDVRTPILYLAPWVDLGGSDKGTIDWFKHVDGSRWAPSLITTQPSANRWLSFVEPYAEEVWSLPDVMPGADAPGFILGFIVSRGVELVHIMNSRLAFDLMPDMTCLARPPAIVVQLHAEEPDRSGYVRYVSTRYGNLVDAFSVTSRQLADAMLDYDVPRSRLEVITTGVDARGEFDPEHVEPLSDLPDDGVQILWPGRLVAQKDPMLTLDVVKLLDERGCRFTLQIVGDGEMTADVRARARALGIEHRIRWHAPSQQMPRWYRSCDLLFMTSVFEGVPYVMYEAQAMGLPVVAPALPGNVEFMGAEGGFLVDPRDDAVGYADALQTLIDDPERRHAIGAQARERMLRDCTLEQMGGEHDALYERLLATRPAVVRQARARDRHTGPLPQPPPPVRLARQPPPERSVAVIVPCYRHGRFLADALRSLFEQTLPPRRIVVVDDASGDPETNEALDAAEVDSRVTVLRLQENMGPSAARNRALAEISERYVLPLDADDLLLPRALEEMVAQLESAPEDVGFVYPNPRHFGNRHDYFEAPAYNLHLLLKGNYCAATSLFDMRVFEAGVRYPEEVVFGHEDWDLVLQLAEHGVRGVPADGATFLYRRRGFSRVNMVEYGPELFHERIEEQHPLLYRDRDRIKGREAPALSLLLVDGCDGVAGGWPDELLPALAAQTCADFEVIRAAPVRGGDHDGLTLTDVAGSGLRLLDTAVAAARGRWVMLAGASAAPALSRATFVEHVLRIFWHGDDLPWFLLAAVDRHGAALGPLTSEELDGARPCAAAWRRDPEGASQKVELGVAETRLDDFALAWESAGPVQWRAA
ncbi:MAG TPA: glycosyltransferase [Conexibacter sp.]|nr:glycosyltransferase [Conexibacter sp.]